MNLNVLTIRMNRINCRIVIHCTVVLLMMVLVQGFSYTIIPYSTTSSSCRTFIRQNYPRTKSLYMSSNSNNEDNNIQEEDCDIAIFGGGFGGLYTALAIHNLQQQQQKLDTKKNKKKFNIVLVEPTEQFVFLPLLYDLTVGTATEQEVCPMYSDILQNTNIRHIRASLQSIDIINNNENKNSIKQSIVASIRPVDDRRSGTPTTLRMKAGILAVGASPESIIASVQGAKQYVQPFYTANDAKQTRRLLNQIEKEYKSTMSQSIRSQPRFAIIGGGYGGVELSACIQRRLPYAHVQLLSRGKPMVNTRAEHLIDAALTKLGVIIEVCNVISFEEVTDVDKNNVAVSTLPKIRINRTKWDTVGDDTSMNVDDELPWDAVLWTAGSLPADPVSTNGCDSLQKSKTGRIAIDPTLQCFVASTDANYNMRQPYLWALGDCAEIVTTSTSSDSTATAPSLPKTAQVAMQQADTVAYNVLLKLLQDEGIRTPATTQGGKKLFKYQDLGSMLTLGGPNAAVLAPKDDTTYGPIFSPLLDVANTALGIADSVAITLGRTPIVEQLGIPTQETLGLSLGSYGLGVPDAPKGTLAGTLVGAARRTVYAVRMPTNQQRVVSLLSASIATAAALLKENSDRLNNDLNKKEE